MKRDRGLETHCAWISVFVERVFLFSIVWSGLLSFRWTLNVMLSEHLLSWIRILQRPVQNEDKHWIAGRLWYSTKSSWILLSTFYWYFIRNKEQRPKVCKLNSTVNIKEKLKVTRAPHASVTPEPKCLRIIQQPAKLANLFQADCSRWPFFCSALKAWKMCLHSKAIKVHRQMLQRRLDGAVTVVAGCAGLGFLDGTRMQHWGCWRHDYWQPWVVKAYLAYVYENITHRIKKIQSHLKF